MSARGYALHSVWPYLSFFVFLLDENPESADVSENTPWTKIRCPQNSTHSCLWYTVSGTFRQGPQDGVTPMLLNLLFATHIPHTTQPLPHYAPPPTLRTPSHRRDVQNHSLDKNIKMNILIKTLNYELLPSLERPVSNSSQWELCVRWLPTRNHLVLTTQVTHRNLWTSTKFHSHQFTNPERRRPLRICNSSLCPLTNRLGSMALHPRAHRPDTPKSAARFLTRKYKLSESHWKWRSKVQYLWHKYRWRLLLWIGGWKLWKYIDSKRRLTSSVADAQMDIIWAVKPKCFHTAKFDILRRMPKFSGCRAIWITKTMNVHWFDEIWLRN